MQKNLKSIYPNIHFSEEKKKGDCLPFSDFKIFCENGRFVSIFIKKFSAVILLQKFWIWNIKNVSAFYSKFRQEVDILKSILHKNNYPSDLVDKFIK